MITFSIKHWTFAKLWKHCPEEGSFAEIDVSTYEKDDADGLLADNSNGGVATAVGAPARPTLSIATELPAQDEIGQPLPTLPLWLADNFSVPLNLEESYKKETCIALRIA